MSDEKSQNIGYVVSETHWDREWYFTFQEFRKWLVRLIDKLVYEIDDHPEFRAFMLDGQTLVLEDYLQIRPYNKAKLQQLIKDDKVQIGPWYVLADEFLESGEGLVRNLLLGHKIGKEFGRIMKVGYVPDTFGHIAQLPQILKGFNIEYGFGFRGYPPVFGNHEEYTGKNEDTALEHMWASANPDYNILMLHALTGYGNLANACENPSVEPDGTKLYFNGISRLGVAYNRLVSRQKSNLFLLMNGTDHLEPEYEINEFIDIINNEEEIQEDIPIQLKHATMEEYFNDLNAQNLDLPTLSGEWRGSMYTQVTPGCISTRMYLKQQNFECQRELEKYSEPLSSMSWLCGGTYDADLIWESWRWVIKNHPHDSICGCSLDRVHDDMETRNKWSLDISSDMALNAMGELTSGIDEKDLVEKIKSKYNIPTNTYEVLTIFNPHSFTGEVNQIAEGLIKLNPTLNYRLFDSNANEITGYLLEGIYDYRKLKDSQYLYKRFKGAYACGRITIPINSLPQFGYETFILVGQKPEKVSDNNTEIDKKSSESPELDHSFVLGKKFLGKNIEVQFNENGTFNMYDKRTEKTYTNMNLFEDGADDGDEYDFASLKDETVLLNQNVNAQLNLIESNDVRSVIDVVQDFIVPENLIELETKTRIRSESTVTLNIKSIITIYKDSDVVSIKTSFNNTAKSHRLRALFPSGINSDYSYADDHFMVMKRTVEKPKDDGWYQLMQGIYHQDTFVDVNDGSHGLSVFNKGLPEYEIVNYENRGLAGNIIALTLVRGVEWLSQYGHSGRKSGLNGPNLPTPGAQCLREFECEYAVYPHIDDWKNGNCYMEAYNYVYPPKMFDKKQTSNLRIKLLKELPLAQSFLNIDNRNLILTTVKQNEKDLSENIGTVVRVFNPTSESQSGNIKVGFKASKISRTNLLEEKQSDIEFSVNDNEINFSIDVKPSEIYTFLIEK